MDTANAADTREHLRKLRRNPLMYLPEARYSVLVAYVCGLDAASEPGLLDGFQDWVSERLLGRSVPYTWWTVIAGLHVPGTLDALPSVALLTADQDREASESLLQLLDEFLTRRQ